MELSASDGKNVIFEVLDDHIVYEVKNDEIVLRGFGFVLDKDEGWWW